MKKLIYNNTLIITWIISFFISYANAQAQTFEWTKRIGGQENDLVLSSTVSKSGHVYTTGFFNDTVDFDPGLDTFNLITPSGNTNIQAMFISKLDASGNFVWAKKIGGTSSVEGKSIVTDKIGNIYTTGSFMGEIDFDPNAGIYNLTSNGGSAIFILKLDSSGNFIWASTIGGSTSSHGFSIVVDEVGNTYTASNYQGMGEDFDPGSGIFNITSTGYYDIVITKLNSSGTFLWAKKIGGTANDYGRSLSINKSSLFVTGYFNETCDFDPEATIFNLTSKGEEDVFISKLDTSGNFIWAKSMGGINSDISLSIAVSASGNIYTTGFYWSTADFDPGAGMFNLTTAASFDIFISKLNSSGDFIWAKSIGQTGIGQGYSIALDSNENVYTTGWFGGTIDTDPNSGVYNLTCNGNQDIFVSILNSSGNFIWSKNFDSNLNATGMTIIIDSSNNIFLTGQFVGTADFDSGPGTFNINSNGVNDLFIHKMSQSTVSISEDSDDNNLKIYPNPSNGFFSIELTSSSQIIITNLLGQEVFNKIIPTGKQTLDIQNQLNGIYLVKIIHEGKQETVKLIKN